MMNGIMAYANRWFVGLIAIFIHCAGFAGNSAAEIPRSMTVFPLSMAGKPSGRVAAVAGIFMEKGGIGDVRVSEMGFLPEKGTSFEDAGQEFSAYLKKNPVDSEYALFAEFLGSPQTGVKEVRIYLAGKDGNLAWSDRQTPDDPDFRRFQVRNPMTCCVLLAERVRNHLGLDDPFRSDAPVGKLQKRMEEEAGMPPKQLYKEMEKRVKLMKENCKEAALTVYPVRTGGQYSRENAIHLQKLIANEKMIEVKTADANVKMKIPGDPNEQKVLWAMAREFQKYVKKNPPETAYALYADYRISKDRPKRGSVHFAVCDKEGEFVIVDFQNEYQEDFKKIVPRTVEDANRLVVARLKHYLR